MSLDALTARAQGLFVNGAWQAAGTERPSVVDPASGEPFAGIACADAADVGAAVAARIDAGHIWINSLQVIAPGSTWGGFKASSIGRELGPWGLSACLGVKQLTIARGADGRATGGRP